MQQPSFALWLEEKRDNWGKAGGEEGRKSDCDLGRGGRRFWRKREKEKRRRRKKRKNDRFAITYAHERRNATLIMRHREIPYP